MSSSLLDEVKRADDFSKFAGEMRKDLEGFGFLAPDGDATAGPQVSTGELRRARRSRDDEPSSLISLVDDGGVLRWRMGSGRAPERPGRRAGSGARVPVDVPGGRTIEQFRFADLPPNQIGKRLQELDKKLTRQQGLVGITRASIARLSDPSAAPADVDFEENLKVPAQGRILLFVHGTFSNSQSVVAELASTAQGKAFLERALASKKYARVLAFNHPTLSLNPLLNAVELARAFGGAKPQVDVVCHSRGGLVTRWWREALSDPVMHGASVFVGSPLAGTGLAAPDRLKSALDLLTNVSQGLSAAAKAAGVLFPPAAPFGQAAAMLFGIFGKITSLAAKTPFIDAGVALVPGLQAQSAEGANAELLRLRAGFDAKLAKDRYWFVQSNFETEDPGLLFWRHFRKGALADRAADILFSGENDLVVDTPSMISLADDAPSPAKGQVKNFGTNSEVHHLNYFRQEETVKHLERALALEG